jgi:hypothetical protein
MDGINIVVANKICFKVQVFWDIALNGPQTYHNLTRSTGNQISTGIWARDSLLYDVNTGSEARQSCYFLGTEVVSLGVKRSVIKADNSPLTYVKLGMHGAIPPIIYMPHSKERYHFTFTRNKYITTAF